MLHRSYLLALAFCWTLSASAQQSLPIDPLSLDRPSLRAHQTDARITLDGRLDEPVWQEADSTDGIFWQVIPDPGMPSRERTVVRVIYTASTLYVGAELYDSEPEGMVSAGLEQDFQTTQSDIFGIALDTYFDRQNAFLLAINPAGALFDAQAFNDQAYVNRSWEGIVDVKTTQHEHGWTAEVAIPFTTLRFNAIEGEQTWGVNFSRRIRNRSEDSNWAALPRQFRVYKMSLAGTLTGLRDLKQGRNLWIKPYARAAVAETGGADAETDFEGGLDLKWGITPQMTLDVTALTDFSQVEVDAQQINLTRFSLFFPEQRDFFLENDGVFNFADVRVRNYRTGSGPQNFKLFHSRRIGLSSGRQPLPIAAGMRLTGRAGDFDVGLLNMQTRSDPLRAAENFSVIRLKRNVLTSSDVGVMFTTRAGTSGDLDGTSNQTVGVDGNFRLFNNLLVNPYFAYTNDQVPNEASPDGNSTTAALQVAWRDPIWDTSLILKHVGDDFNPGIGFVSRRAVRQAFFTFGAHPRPKLKGIFELNPYMDVDVFTNLDGTLETRTLTPGFGVRFLDSGLLEFEFANRFERIFEETSLAGAAILPGEYEFNEANLSYLSDTGRPLSTFIGLTRGGFFGGTRTSVLGVLNWRPNAHWYFRGTLQRNNLEFAGVPVDANLYSLRVQWGLNTRTFVSAFVQYNEAAETLVTNLRFNFIHAPLSDVFLVFQDVRRLDDDPTTALVMDRAITLKVTRLFAF